MQSKKVSHNKAYIYTIYTKISSIIFVNILFNAPFSREIGRSRKLVYYLYYI